MPCSFSLKEIYGRHRRCHFRPSKVISPPFWVKVGWVALSYNRCTCIPKAHSTFCPFSFCFVLFSSAFRPLFFVFGHFVFLKVFLLRMLLASLLLLFEIRTPFIKCVQDSAGSEQYAERGAPEVINMQERVINIGVRIPPTYTVCVHRYYNYSLSDAILDTLTLTHTATTTRPATFATKTL